MIFTTQNCSLIGVRACLSCFICLVLDFLNVLSPESTKILRVGGQKRNAAPQLVKCLPGFDSQYHIKPDMTACACDACTEETETGESGVQAHPWLQSKFKVSLQYMKPSLKKEIYIYINEFEGRTKVKKQPWLPGTPKSIWPYHIRLGTSAGLPRTLQFPNQFTQHFTGAWVT